jgi:ATP-dependent DNA helicase RecQ
MPDHRLSPAIPASPDRLREALHASFGHREFRPLQREIAESILRGRDVFALMPTGGGKSLCYQLPALLQDGLTVVVSPLIALMKDQVDALVARSVPATFINSALEPDEVSRRQAAVARGAVKLLYVAPERLMTPGFLRLLESAGVRCFAIDEAHCISEWGHDFRLDYRELKQLRSLFPDVVIAAFTATATARVQRDIVAQLGLRQPALFRGSFNRPNLFYDVRPKASGSNADLIAYVRRWEGQSGIVYCQSRAETERVAALLRMTGLPAAAYHAGLASDERKRRQDDFLAGKVRVIVATIAFGMGIDKPNVRFVVHYDLPKSLEGYAQESGRAGRDGAPSECVLFYSYGDTAKIRYFIDRIESETQQIIARQQLQQMTNWASGTVCRRRALLAYFDEPFTGQAGPCCDVCRSPAPEIDWTTPAQMFMSCIKRTGERFGAQHIIDVLRGGNSERILRLGHDRLSTYGIGRDRLEDEWWYLARQLLAQGYVRRAPEDHDALKVMEPGVAVLYGKQPLFLPAAPESRKRPQRPKAAARSTHPRDVSPLPDDEYLGSTPADNDYPDFDRELFERLRTLRKRIADEHGWPAYVVFPDRVLRGMATVRPANLAQLRRIKGVGPQRAEAYGEQFLQEIARSPAPVRLETQELQAGARDRAARIDDDAENHRPPSATISATLKLLHAGRSPAEIAAARRLSPSTVEGHIGRAIEGGESIDLDRLVLPEKRRVIEAAIAELGMASNLSPLREWLGDGYSFGEIRFVLAALRASALRR